MVNLKLEAHTDFTMWAEAFPRLRDDINDYRLRNRSELSPVLRLMLEETAPVFLLVNAVVLCALRSPDGAPLKVPLDTAAGAAFIISNTMLGENIGRGIKKADSLKCHPERWWYAGFRKGLELSGEGAAAAEQAGVGAKAAMSRTTNCKQDDANTNDFN